MRGLFLFFAILAAACVQATFGNEKSGKQGENRLLRKISNGQLILTDEKLSKSQLKKIAKSDNLESLKLGQNPEACFLEPGGIEILGTSRTLEKISLYVSNFSQLNISALSKIPTLHTLEIGGGPFLYDSDGERQPAVIENYCAILTDETVKQILTIKSVKKIKINIPFEDISPSHISALAKLPNLQKLEIISRDLLPGSFEIGLNKMRAVTFSLQLEKTPL